jgi:lipopolysaccharide transport system permease protein
MARHCTEIQSGKRQRGLLGKLWSYRELFFFLAWRDVLVRYKQTVLGVLWGVLRPILAVGVFSLIFGSIAKLPTQGVPYPILVFSAMLPWQFFANCLSESSTSLIANVNLISKVYFPRIIIPISSMLVNLIDFVVTFFFFCLLLLFYSGNLSWNWLLIPFLLCWTIFISLGFGFWFSALNVKYRDFRYIVPFLIQFGLYVSPVGFSSIIVPGKWRHLFYLNPMAGVIDSFRWVLLNGKALLFWPGIFASALVTLLVFVSGFFYFSRTEKTFADVI